ncbi:hypothetical protein [Mycolicibacterium sarraceniae]|uniref:Uncharacterized protein n=1 Tax=Mycolicibacterium sarraceniae TaxID=1534348 RepID=A0A7I7SQA1_9MYCO|nr:hypothetical protein [Mycolicibacterium sarraceniae]BBY59162.1 hypothetical protein MSAR_22980 [Mycolicibacterium sarraceniae]
MHVPHNFLPDSAVFDDDDGVLPECWLIAQWPTTAAEPTDYWLSTLRLTAPKANGQD